MLHLYKIAFIFLFLVSIFSVQPLMAQQENQFTQFMYNKLYLNPAYAGVRGTPSLTLLYRKQWMGFEGAPESNLLSFSTPLVGDKVGLGIIASTHQEGISKNWFVSMAYAYNLKINKDNKIRFGIQGTMRHLSLNFDNPKLVIQQGGDPSIMQGLNTGDFYGNFGVGVYYEHKTFHFGFGVPNLFSNEISFNEDPNVQLVAKEIQHYYIMTGMTLKVNNRLNFKPALLAKYVKNAPFDMDINASLVYDERVTFGLSYRLGGDGSGESIDLLAMYQLRQFALGIAYDFGLSELGNESNGSFEIIGRYDFGKSSRDLTNPRFFK